MLEFLLSASVTGDALHNLRILKDWHDPDGNVELYSRQWFLFPVLRFLLSKDFLYDRCGSCF